jgi:hypothetical protein
MEKGDVEQDDSCPCGSGRRSQHCCRGKERASASSSVLGGAMRELRQALAGKEFASEEELQAFVQDFNEQLGRRPLDDFSGLSPEQMHRFLYFPFDSPQLVAFPPRLGIPPTAPFLTLFRLLARAMGEGGLKATARGNLPRKLVQEAASAFEGEGGDQRYAPRSIRTEADFFELHVTRLVAELSGFIRKSKGRFVLRRDGRVAAKDEAAASLYPRLFLIYVRDFNWAYWDAYPALPFIQQSFLFTLYLLTLHGDQWRPSTYYEDAFLRAFPKVLEEVAPVSYSTPESLIRSCYSWRVLERFAGFMGLVEIRRESNRLLDRSFQVRSTPLLKETVRFRITAATVVPTPSAPAGLGSSGDHPQGRVSIN